MEEPPRHAVVGCGPASPCQRAPVRSVLSKVLL